MRLINALLRKPVDKTPVWIMRQAGRYLPEYRQTRAKAGSFMNLCKTPKLACEVTLQPLKRFDLDAAILFSDILTIPDAFGMGLYFSEGEGPKFTKTLDSLKDIESLTLPDIDASLHYVFDAIELIKSKLNPDTPLIGFAGSPFTLACYMLEGGGSKQFHRIKTLLYQHSDVLHRLLQKLSLVVSNYLNRQIEAGVDVVMIFDSWGGILTAEAYQNFSLHYLKQIISGLIKQRDAQVIPNIIFTKGGNLWLEAMVDSNCHAIGIDWTIDIAEAKKRVQGKAALQGNLDPAILLASPEIIGEEARKILTAYGRDPGLVFNLGHGITPDIPPEHVAALVEAVHES